MDAYSVSFTSVSQRNFSRIWKDLKTCRQYSIMEMAVEDVSENPSLGQRIGEYSDTTLTLFIAPSEKFRSQTSCRCQYALTYEWEHAGPNWIHGTNDNPILDLANETKTATGQWEERSSVIDEAGNQLPALDAITYSTIMWDVVGAAFAYSNKYSATISPDESLWDFFQKEVPRRIPDTEENFKRKRNYVYQLADQWGAFVGSHVFTQSLKFFWLEECIDGENLFVADTYEKILQLVAKPAIEGATIKYETIVNRIQSTNDEGGALKVYTEAGESFEFDEVVLTAPLGWLKRHTDAFEPALPSRLTKAIKSIGYGCLEKAYISFPKAFWTLDRSEENRIEGFCQLLAPNYATDRNPKKWNQEFVELASLKSSAHPTLLFYFYGDQSKFITGELAKLSSKEKRDAFLYDWFKPYYSRLPNYDESSPTASLMAVTRPSGSMMTSPATAAIVISRGLWLAGEHTAPFVALGTATGAYWSGESVGKRIAQAYSRGEGGVMVLN
ncbi:hypothetical protein ABKA04_003933 [Annulohypoxylon sp. FPYF3050]